jgi:hypothetical protein
MSLQRKDQRRQGLLQHTEQTRDSATPFYFLSGQTLKVSNIMMYITGNTIFENHETSLWQSDHGLLSAACENKHRIQGRILAAGFASGRKINLSESK